MGPIEQMSSEEVLFIFLVAGEELAQRAAKSMKEIDREQFNKARAGGAIFTLMAMISTDLPIGARCLLDMRDGEPAREIFRFDLTPKSPEQASRELH